MILGLCCAGLLLLAGLLWVMVRERSDPEAAPMFPRPGVVGEKSSIATSPMFVHPRMDLASGNVPPNQAVNLDQRRARQMANSSTPWRPKQVGFEPFAERRKLPGARQRLDLVYAREGMGDLSDPDIRPVPHWKGVDLQTALPAK